MAKRGAALRRTEQRRGAEAKVGEHGRQRSGRERAGAGMSVDGGLDLP